MRDDSTTPSKVTRHCETCGASFTRFRAHTLGTHGRFCSRRCASANRRKYHPEPRPCQRCGETFTPSGYSDAIGAGKFCSNACYHASGPGVAPTPMIEKFWPKVAIAGPDDCWLWATSARMGKYPAVGGKYAHRVAYELANGPIPDGLLVCHRCDNPLCCNPAHLFVGTYSDNTRDMNNKGRGPTVKLTPDDVRYIREQTHRSNKDLARQFGVKDAAISKIRTGRTWRHI